MLNPRVLILRNILIALSVSFALKLFYAKIYSPFKYRLDYGTFLTVDQNYAL